MLSSTTRLKIQASNTGRCAKLMGSGRSCPLPGRSIFTADSQQRSREQGELMPGDCGGRLRKEKLMAISTPSAGGKENCDLGSAVCRLFRPRSELANCNICILLRE